MEKVNQTARLASLDEIVQNVVPLFIKPTPCLATVRAWLDAARVPRFKSNPTAKRGGGTVFYSVAGVEKLFRSRTMPKIGGIRG